MDKNKFYSELLTSASGNGRKRIFIGLLSATCAVLCLFVFVFLILPWLGIQRNYLLHASVTTGIFCICLLSWLCLSLVFHIYTGRQFPGINKIRHILIRVMLPFMEIVGKFFGFKKDVVRRSFIKVNNEFVLGKRKKVNPQDILLLLPHCIQASACKRRLNVNLDNCGGCGQCQVGAIKELAATHGVKVAIATGGTIARRIIVECKPRYIIAVACERDLTSGIQDSYPLPVFGILNSRPKGPCHDTVAPLSILTMILANVASPGARPDAGIEKGNPQMDSLVI